MKIILTNDDGIDAPGLQSLLGCVQDERKIIIVAPTQPQSGIAHKVTTRSPIRVNKLGSNRYSVDGTPSDCVHLALTGFLDDEPDLVVSGINHGANLGDDVIYSGTVAAALEGRFLGLPTIAVSLVGRQLQHFDTAARVAAELVAKLDRSELAPDVVLNVNVPNRPFAELEGIRATRLGFRHKSEQIIKDTDPYGRAIYWVGPAGEGQDAGEGTDFHAVENGAASVTPLRVDLTRHEAVKGLEDWLKQ